jgi:antitoxin (DNA-binding transcriptional repressor) of toxin-antitoxin stability system
MGSSLEAHEAEGSPGEKTESSVGAYEAKTHLGELLDRVEGGETITITRHGNPSRSLFPHPAAQPGPMSGRRSRR